MAPFLARLWKNRRNRTLCAIHAQEQNFLNGIKRQRIKLGYSTREMAALMGTTQEYVEEFERELNPTLSEIRHYCAALNITYFVTFREVY
jgi:transcriptional regulator with XRE-family HTH domain